MGLFNSFKNTFKENYDLEEIDEFVYEDDYELKDGENTSTSDISSLVDEFEKNYERHERDSSAKPSAVKTQSKSRIKKSAKSKTSERRSKARAEEAKYDQLLNSVQAETLIHAVEKINRQEEKEKLSGKLQKEEKKEEEYIENLKKEAEKEHIVEVVGKVTSIDEEEQREEQRLEQQLEASEQKAYEEKAVEIPDVNRQPRKLEEVNTDHYDKDAAREYVRNQCEIMDEATRHIEKAMEEYNIVTEHFTDIQLIDTAPANVKQRILEEASRVDNLTVDRRIFRSGEHKLSNNTYHRMEQFEQELPRGIKYLEKQETYYETVKRDMRLLEAERMNLRMEASALTHRQLRIRSLGIAAIVGLIAVFLVFFVAFSVTEDSQNTMLYIVVAFLGAALALGMLALLKYTERQVLTTEIKLNKVTGILNKTKIKYINATNTLDYEYNKYRVKSSYELEKKYEVYMDMKNEQRRVVTITTHLNQAEEELVSDLRKLGLNDPRLWLGQVKALTHSKEMVEVRHELNNQRQKLRKQIEYNEGRIEEARNNIMKAAAEHPENMQEALDIIEQYTIMST